MKLCLTFLLFIAFAAISFAAPYFESNDVAADPTSGIEIFTFGDLGIDDEEESDQEVFTLEDLEGDDDTGDDDTDDDSIYSHVIAGEDDSKTDLEALTLGDLEDDDNDSAEWYWDVEENKQDTGLEFKLKGLSGEEIENYGIGSIFKIIPKLIKGIKKTTKKGKGNKGNSDGTFPATKTRKINVAKGNKKPSKGKGKSTKGKHNSSKGKSKGSKGSKKGKKSK